MQKEGSEQTMGTFGGMTFWAEERASRKAPRSVCVCVEGVWGLEGRARRPAGQSNMSRRENIGQGPAKKPRPM